MPESKDNNNRNWFVLLTATFALSVCLPMPGPHGRIAEIPPFCPFYLLTGLPCPGCGLTRAFVCLGHGRLQESLHWHPLGWAAFGVCLLAWGRTGLAWIARAPIRPFPANVTRFLTIAAAIIFVGVGILRIAITWKSPSRPSRATVWSQGVTQGKTRGTLYLITGELINDGTGKNTSKS